MNKDIICATDTSRVEFGAFISNNGRNGKVFSVKIPNVSEKVVCKISRILDYSVRHEYSVMDVLYKINQTNFPEPYMYREMLVDCNYRKKLNPFKISSETYPILTDVLFMEYIDGVCLEDFAKTHPHKLTFNICRQVILASMEAYEKCAFTHYDLHPGNVIVRKTDVSSLTYVVGKKTHTVNTHGYIGVVIDFGLSYVDGLDFQYSALHFTDIGVFPFSRPLYDIRVFLVGICKDTASNKIPKTIRKLFGRDVDMSHGWDVNNDDCTSAINHVHSLVYEKSTAMSCVFSKYGSICIGLVQSLAQYPLSDKPGVHKSYRVLEGEFSKIESVIGSDFYNIYILGKAIDSARSVLSKYINDSMRASAVKMFKRDVVSVIDTISKFAKLETVDWEKFLCALYAFSQYISYVMREYIKEHAAPDNSRITDLNDIYTEISKIFNCAGS